MAKTLKADHKMCAQSDEYVYAHGTTRFWHFNDSQYVVLHAYNGFARSESVKMKCGKCT